MIEVPHFSSPTAAFHTLRYEDLLLQPETELRKLCAKIGETFESRMLDTARSADHVNKTNEPWKVKVAESIDQGRGRVWTREMTPSQNRLAEAILGKRLKEFGYPTQEVFLKRANLVGCITGFPVVLEKLSAEYMLLYAEDTNRERDLDVYFGNPFKEGWMRRYRGVVEGARLFHEHSLGHIMRSGRTLGNG